MLPSKLKIVCCHISRLVRKHLLCKIEVWNFKVTTILGRACDLALPQTPKNAFFTPPFMPISAIYAYQRTLCLSAQVQK